ncbi:MAG: purine/pyrimidine permease [Bacteriovoracales bacterium]|nr:purine/pyrimidine permease [Bacteriovoracales bacterium]
MKVRYEPNESPPLPLSFALGLQNTMITIAGTVFGAAIVMRTAGVDESYLPWAIFSAILVSGLTTIIQSVRMGRIGSGHALLMGTSGTFLAVSVSAINEGGLPMLASLVALSSLFQFLFSAKLSFFRRVITPSVAGTIIMLIAVSVMPILFNMLDKVPESAPSMAAPLIAAVSLFVTLIIIFKGTPTWKLWSPVIGIVVGTIVASFFGVYESDRVAEAPWFGLPSFEQWPGFHLEFDSSFWSLLLSFLFVTIVGAIETIGDAIAIQQVSRRKNKAIDFKSVQGAVGTDGLGNLFSGLLGTIPNTTYSSSVSVVELTGVASRRVGICTGLIFISLAFFPKALAVILAIPGPVAAAYMAILITALFFLGMKMCVQNCRHYHQSLIVGISFWVGAGFENNQIFSSHLGPWSKALLENGMTSGGLTAIFLTLLMELVSKRPKRLRTPLETPAISKVKEFLKGFAKNRNQKDLDKLCLVAEEALMGLLEKGDQKNKRHLLLMARQETNEIELEFVAGPGKENLEDQMSLIGKHPERFGDEREISLKILKHLTSSIQHHQYHGMDIITVSVKFS